MRLGAREAVAGVGRVSTRGSVGKFMRSPVARIPCAGIDVAMVARDGVRLGVAVVVVVGRRERRVLASVGGVVILKTEKISNELFGGESG